MDLPQIDGAAPADEPLGLLERGRGAGWTFAAQSGFGQDLLLACLRREPRWDRQVESRADYYAALALHVGVPISELTPRPIDEDDEWILLEVLEAMAERGSVAAAETVRTVQRDPSTSVPPVTGRPRANSNLSPDSPIEELLAASRPPFPKAVIHRLRTSADPIEVDALRSASQHRDHPGWRLALHVLARRGDTTPLASIEQVLAEDEPGSLRAAAFQYMRALPGHISVPFARAWLTHSDGRGAVAAAVLGSHAELPDEAAIRNALANANDYYTVSSLVEALGRLPSAGPFPELDEVYCLSAYSYARARVVESMALTDPDFPQKWAAECLWDCEATVRIWAARLAPDERTVHRRLQELADDVYEDPDVRQEARHRLR